MTSLRPIEIVGGGLAGLSLGLALRHADVPVVLSEAGSYPRHRVCGEFIAGLSTETQTRLGLTDLLADALHHREAGWFINGQLARTQTLPLPALGLSRHRLDARLAAAFVAQGGTLRTNTRVAHTPASQRREGLVFTTGRRRAETGWIGLKVHARDLLPQLDVELHLGRHAYVGLSRIENGEVNICGLFRRRRLNARGPEVLSSYLRAAGLDGLADRLAAATIDPASFCAIAAVEFDARVPGGNAVRLGDACAMIPPFTGNGMAMAFQSAEIAVDPLVRYARGELAWADATTQIADGLRRRFRVRLATAHWLHPMILEPRRQQLVAQLARRRLLPFGPLYALTH